MFTRSGDDAVPGVDTQASGALLAKQQRYYDAKMDRLDALEAAIGAQYVGPAAEPNTGMIDVDQFRADQNAALAARARFFEAKIAQLEQLDARQAGQSSIDVGQLQADRMERADYYAWRHDQSLAEPDECAMDTVREFCRVP
jgi:hypothetical protein